MDLRTTTKPTTDTTESARSQAVSAADSGLASSLRLRPYAGSGDHPAMAEISTGARRAAGFAEQITTAELDVQYAHLTNSDPTTDAVVAELEGRVAGYGRVSWADRNSGERAFETVAHVRPADRGRGVGRALLRWQLARVLSIVEDMADDLAERQALVAAYAYGTDERGARLLARHGFGIARRHAEMRRPDLDAIPELPLPPGLLIRPIDPVDRAIQRRVFDADVEVFRDHWGDVDGSESAWQAFVESPDIQPELWQVAFDRESGEIAGQILNYLAPGPDGRTIGWTESIAVRRPYRRRGLARALLARSLARVRAAGAESAALGVDQQNENRALELYRSLGFEVVAEQFEYHRPLDGIDSLLRAVARPDRERAFGPDIR